LGTDRTKILYYNSSFVIIFCIATASQKGGPNKWAQIVRGDTWGNKGYKTLKFFFLQNYFLFSKKNYLKFHGQRLSLQLVYLSNKYFRYHML